MQTLLDSSKIGLRAKRWREAVFLASAFCDIEDLCDVLQNEKEIWKNMHCLLVIN